MHCSHGNTLPRIHKVAYLSILLHVYEEWRQDINSAGTTHRLKLSNLG